MRLPRFNFPLLHFGLLSAVSSVSAAIVQFDVTDNIGASPVAAGWVGVTGASDNADTISGGDGVHSLTLATTGDGQDRDRNSAQFPADSAMWRDFWFVANSTVGGAQATATLSGFDADTEYTVEIWGFDFSSTGTRSVVWSDAVTGNSATSSFDGATSSAPSSLANYAAVLAARADASGVIRLTGAGAAGGAGGLPNIFVNGLRVSSIGGDPGGATFPLVEAESGSLGSDYQVSSVAGVTAISPKTNNTGSTPGSAARVASYTVQFSKADIYQLYVRIQVGPGTFGDDSFFYASSFGAKSPTTGSNWVAVLSGLVDTGYTGAAEQIVVGGGSAGSQVWKWVKFGTFFTVGEGALTQTFQLGSREDGFSIDKFAFAPADVPLTVAELESGVLPERPPTESYPGADGVALHRFDEPYKATNHEGAGPVSGLVMQDGLLWGVTSGGGLQGAGTIYKVGPDGADFEVANTLPAEIGPGRPHGGLTPGAGGVFYGVSQTGGASGTGTVFRRGADGAIVVLKSFSALVSHTGLNVGGAAPVGPLLLSGSMLYGATTLGGANGQGVVFSLNVDGTGFAVLKEFGAVSPVTGYNEDGAQPCGGLIASGSTLYGVAASGGPGGTGVVFSLATSGTGYSVLHAFGPLDAATATNAGGAFPCNGVVFLGDRLHGSTLGGGGGGRGTLYSVSTGGSAFSVLHEFSKPDPATGANSDGAAAVGRLTASGNVLYGVASAGGAGGTGAVFSLDVTDPVLRTLHHFGPLEAEGLNARGAYPVAELLRSGDTLYGTAVAGGPGGTGVVFAIPLPLSIEIAAVSLGGGAPTLTVTGNGGPFSSYTVEATSDLGAPNSWQAVLTAPADASGRVTYTELLQGVPRRFFRLRPNP
jgi:uncharacterized repeat protein (TIGR03803 family)